LTPIRFAVTFKEWQDSLRVESVITKSTHFVALPEYPRNSPHRAAWVSSLKAHFPRAEGLPGIGPGSRCIEVPLVTIVSVRDAKLADENLYYQASVPKQIGSHGISIVRAKEITISSTS
jgi:hypothetical protein